MYSDNTVKNYRIEEKENYWTYVLKELWQRIERPLNVSKMTQTA